MKKYFGIEILRFLTSLAVLFYHYRHFFNPFNSESELKYTVAQTDLPFKNLLDIFYENGILGVQVFYTISGFVFTYIYYYFYQTTSYKTFFLNRFARLYPLHFATLILVTLLQIISNSSLGNFQIYQFNDLYHFILHLFFISSWGFEQGHSFNGPIWSVSVEILIYIIFFLSLLLIKKYKIYLIIIFSLLLLSIDKLINYESLFLECARLFFSGSLVYFIVQNQNIKKYLLILSILLIFLSFLGNFKIYLFCPSVLLLFIQLDNYLNYEKIKNLFYKLGNLTYAIYLLHVPMQLLIILAFGYFSIPDTIFTNELFFISFILILLLISNICFIRYEKPLNKKIRKIFG